MTVWGFISKMLIIPLSAVTEALFGWFGHYFLLIVAILNTLILFVSWVKLSKPFMAYMRNDFYPIINKYQGKPEEEIGKSTELKNLMESDIKRIPQKLNLIFIWASRLNLLLLLASIVGIWLK